MYFDQQQIGTSDIAILELTISRCIIAKILEDHGVLPADYKFYDSSFLSQGYNYEQIFSYQARMDTLNEALELLKLGSVKSGEIEDGVYLHLNVPGLVLTGYEDFFSTDEFEYDWQADSYVEENEEALAAVGYEDSFLVLFTDFKMLPHQILQNILMKLKGE